MNKKLELSERFAAQLKLDKLPKTHQELGLGIDVVFQEDHMVTIEN